LTIHPTAIVHRKAEIASDVEIGPYCIIDAEVRIAAGCRLYQNVYVTGWTEIGEGCVLHPGVIVGHEPQDAKYHGERTYCRIGRNNIIREYVTIHRGTTPESETHIGDECFVLAGAHIGHNCRIGNKVTIINDVLLGGHVSVGDQATLGGQSGFHQFVRVGELVMVAGTGLAVLDVVPFALTDTHGRIAGLNRVGLRRAGYPPEHVRDLREAYRVLFARALSLNERVSRLQTQVRFPPAQRLVEFLLGESKRGMAGRPRRSLASSATGNPDSV
jgi:UDP-N-acetylglucosamine acyltransferase